MICTQRYDSPLGGILLAADESGLTGLWFDGGKHFAEGLPAAQLRQETPILAAAKRWLDIYFTGREPDFLPPLHPAVPCSNRRCGRCSCRSPTDRP